MTMHDVRLTRHAHDLDLRDLIPAPRSAEPEADGPVVGPHGGPLRVLTVGINFGPEHTGIAPYTAAKGAVKNLTKGMCTDWARHGLQINAIGPGYFATPLNQALIENPDFDAWLKTRTPAGRWGRVEELQGACIFLASSASDFVNGQILYVDGGVLATL